MEWSNFYSEIPMTAVLDRQARRRRSSSILGKRLFKSMWIKWSPSAFKKRPSHYYLKVDSYEKVLDSNWYHPKVTVTI